MHAVPRGRWLWDPQTFPCAPGTHRTRRDLSWLKVSALTSQMRLCWRSLGQQDRLGEWWALTLAALHTPFPSLG